MGEFGDLAQAAKAASDQRLSDERARHAEQQTLLIAKKNEERAFLMDKAHPIFVEALAEFEKLVITGRIFTSWGITREPPYNFIRLELIPTPLNPIPPEIPPTNTCVTVTRNLNMTKVTASVIRGADEIVCGGELRDAIAAAFKHVLPMYYQLKSRQPTLRR